MGTNGSVLPLFKKQILTQNCVTVTDPKMTRFLMSTREAIHLIFEAVHISKGGETFVMRMPAIEVSEITKTMIKKYGNKDTKINIIGSRPGEKVHEILVSRNEIPRTYELSDKYFVIIPEESPERYVSLISGLKKTNLIEFSSQNADIMTHQDLMVQIEKEKWA